MTELKTIKEILFITLSAVGGIFMILVLCLGFGVIGDYIHSQRVDNFTQETKQMTNEDIAFELKTISKQVNLFSEYQPLNLPFI